VEITAEGEEENLKKLRAWCQKGPLLAQIEKVESHWKEATGEFENFNIK